MNYGAVVRLLNAAKTMLVRHDRTYPSSWELRQQARDELALAIAEVEALINPRT